MRTQMQKTRPKQRELVDVTDVHHVGLTGYAPMGLWNPLEEPPPWWARLLGAKDERF